MRKQFEVLLIAFAAFCGLVAQVSFAQSGGERKYLRQIFKSTPNALESVVPSKYQTGCKASAVLGQVEMEVLSAAEVAAFNDPFGQRVFLPSPDERKFSKIIDLLLQRASTNADPGYELVIVREWIKQSQPNVAPIDRRFVVLFDQSDLRSQCMLSGVLTPAGIAEDLQFLEAWGWDAQAKTFRYYELADDGWSFAGTSPQLGEPTGLSASNRCLHCHRTGTPIMKELRLPWNNWNSLQSPNDYLSKIDANVWPGIKTGVADVGDPEDLEKAIKSAIGRFNRSLISGKTQTNDSDRVIKDIKLLIEPLFVDRDLNFASSQDNSPKSAFSSSSGTPSGTIRIPGGMLLAHRLIGNGDTNFPGLGLGIAGKLDQTIKMPAVQYANLVESNKLAVKITDPTTGVASLRPGTDTDFAFFTPVRSYADDHFVGRLLKENILTREFIASAILTDVDEPILSETRRSVFERLQDVLPDEIVIPKTLFADPKEHPLTKLVIDHVAANALPDDDPLKSFADVLSQNDSPVDTLEKHWTDQNDALVQATQNPSTPQSKAVFKNLFKNLLARRKSFSKSTELRVLDETANPTSGRSEALLPSPPPEE